MNALLEVFLNTFWQAAAVAFVVWAGLRFMPRINAATRGAIWWSVLVLVMLLPVIRLVGVRPRPAAVARSVVYTVPSAYRAVATVVSPGPRAPVRVRPGNWARFFLALWSAVCLAQIVRLALSFRHLRRLKRSAIPAAAAQRANLDAWLPAYGIRRPVRLLLSPDIPVPVAVGFLRPAVLLPESLLAELTPEELDHVLLHELAHLARGDDWANLLARCAWAVLALHPVAAFALRQIDRERELACDDWVVSATGAARPYAASLARLFELCTSQRGSLLASGISDGGSQLGDRIALLMRRGREFTPRASMMRVSVCTAVLLLFVVAASRAPAWMAFAQTPVNVSSTRAVRRFAGPMPVSSQSPRTSLLSALVANGYGDLSVDEIVSLKNAGVSAEFIAGIAQSGIGKLRPPMLIALKQQGVEPEYIHGILALGFGPYAVQTFIDFRHQGVPIELFEGLKEYGLMDADPREIRDARTHGVSPSSLREARQYSSNLNLKQIIRLKEAGVI